jgi:putative FmdB family regulatory protein
MPLYEYECDACGHRFERIQKFSDPLVDKCPTCGGKVRKLLSSPAIQFKGSGWYITDYAKKGGSVDSGKSASSSKSDETSESKNTSTDKPAEKSTPDTNKTS